VISIARLNRTFLIAAAAASLAVSLVSAVAAVPLGVALGGASFVFVAIALAIETRRERSAAEPADQSGPRRKGAPSAFAGRAAQQIEEGRRLVIYEQETGLYAPWYIALRCEEECYRSVRYKLPFSVLVLQPAPQADVWTVRGQLADWLRRKRRRSDIPGHLEDGRFVLLMPETDTSGAQKIAQRLSRSVAGIQVGHGRHIEDGGNLEQLVAAAADRISLNGHAAEAA
jgi:GGDEF domain-containing protein